MNVKRPESCAILQHAHDSDTRSREACLQLVVAPLQQHSNSGVRLETLSHPCIGLHHKHTTLSVISRHKSKTVCNCLGVHCAAAVLLDTGMRRDSKCRTTISQEQQQT